MPRALTSGASVRDLNSQWISRLLSGRPEPNAGAAVVAASCCASSASSSRPGMIVFIAVAGAAAFVLWKVSHDLPDYEILAKYEPPVMTRIHAHDGTLIAEFARERRIFVPINAIPRCVIAGLHLGRGQELLRAWRPRHSRHRPRRRPRNIEQRAVGPARRRRLDHHPAGGQELPADQRPDHGAQAEGSDPRHPHRARLHQGARSSSSI